MCTPGTARYSGRLGQPGDLHDHVEVGRALARVNTFERGHVSVVAADAHTDVLLGDFGVIGGVVVPPTPGPGLNPGVASPIHGIPHNGVTFGVQVTRHITPRNSHAAQHH